MDGALKIRVAYVNGQGDPSVGISGGSATVQAEPGGFLLDCGALSGDDVAAAVEDFRSGLMGTFGDLWGDAVRVVFDFEAEPQADVPAWDGRPLIMLEPAPLSDEVRQKVADFLAQLEPGDCQPVVLEDAPAGGFSVGTVATAQGAAPAGMTRPWGGPEACPGCGGVPMVRDGAGALRPVRCGTCGKAGSLAQGSTVVSWDNGRGE